MLICEALMKVQAFHDKLGISPVQPLNPQVHKQCSVLRHVGMVLKEISKSLEPRVAHETDQRYVSTHLLLEETAEFIIALAMCDEDEAFDGISDILFVLLGRALQFDLPIAAGFAEVARSNLTKEKQPEDKLKNRVRDKGPNYSPPDLKRILKQYREDQKIEL